jgi:class 3 adenylate cyclase
MLDLSSLSMTEIIRLQNQLSQELSRRFEKPLALAFSDIVGSTPYFARFGDEAGRKLQQRHFDLLGETLPPVGGRIVDTAGDGAFAVFPSAEAAADALIEFQKRVSAENQGRSRDHQLVVRIGIHWGRVLTDDVQVTGDAVNLAARVTASAEGGEIRLTKETFQEFTKLSHRLACRGLGTVELKGITRPIDLMVLEWRDRSTFPSHARIEETGEEIALPAQDTIAFGRLKENEGMVANDVVLMLPDVIAAKQISRWHFELRRHGDGFRLRPVSGQATEVDGQMVPKGQEVLIKPGTRVRLSNVMTLLFLSPMRKNAMGTDATMIADDSVG